MKTLMRFEIQLIAGYFRRCRYFAALAGILLFLGESRAIYAFLSSDADNILNSYKNSFYVVSSRNRYYKMDTTGGREDFWRQAEEIEMVIDAYERSGSSVYKGMISELINGFINHNGSDWTGIHSTMTSRRCALNSSTGAVYDNINSSRVASTSTF